MVINPWTGEEYKSDSNSIELPHTYPVPWIISADGNTLQISHKESTVLIVFASTGLGDNLAWMPIVDTWLQQNSIKDVHIITNWTDLFSDIYPYNFYKDKESFKMMDIGVSYTHFIGIPDDPDGIIAGNPRENQANPVHWHFVS